MVVCTPTFYAEGRNLGRARLEKQVPYHRVKETPDVSQPPASLGFLAVGSSRSNLPLKVCFPLETPLTADIDNVGSQEDRWNHGESQRTVNVEKGFWHAKGCATWLVTMVVQCPVHGASTTSHHGAQQSMEAI